MTFLPPVGGAISPPSAILSRQVLDMQVRVRRARLAELEAEMIAACEAAARGARQQTSAGFEREHWDRATWHRYLVAGGWKRNSARACAAFARKSANSNG